MDEYRFLSRRGFNLFVKGLAGEYRVYGPVRKDGIPTLSRILEPVEPILTPVHISFRGFLLPPREVILRFNIKEERYIPIVEAEDQVLLGVHPCDIHAIRLLDKVFSYGTPDRNYMERRKKTIIIGMDCMPDEHCFCMSVNTMEVASGFDLFLHVIEGGFLVRTGTERGAELLSRHASTQPAKKKDIRGLEEFRQKKERAFITRLEAEPDALPLIYAGAYFNDIWERKGEICYGCGSCNHVCPTCYCFDVRDKVSGDLSEGERCRVWDGCMLEDFAKVAGGHNFRKKRSQRLRHRFLRKFQYQRDRFGGLFCVGCGRCIRTCLVGINIAEVTNEIIRSEEKR